MNDTRETINLVFSAGVIASNRISQINTYADGIDIDGYWFAPGDPSVLIEGNIIVGGTDPNADGIDFGSARNVIFRNNIVMDFADKGISIGEGSRVVGYNNLISGCNMGVAIKSASSPELSNFTPRLPRDVAHAGGRLRPGADIQRRHQSHRPVGCRS